MARFNNDAMFGLDGFSADPSGSPFADDGGSPFADDEGGE